MERVGVLGDSIRERRQKMWETRGGGGLQRHSAHPSDWRQGAAPSISGRGACYIDAGRTNSSVARAAPTGQRGAGAQCCCWRAAHDVGALGCARGPRPVAAARPPRGGRATAGWPLAGCWGSAVPAPACTRAAPARGYFCLVARAVIARCHAALAQPSRPLSASRAPCASHRCRCANSHLCSAPRPRQPLALHPLRALLCLSRCSPRCRPRRDPPRLPPPPTRAPTLMLPACSPL